MRLSDTKDLRTGMPAETEGDAVQPLDPRLRELSNDLDANLADPSAPPTVRPETFEIDPAEALDLFAGPPEPRRENLPQSVRRSGPAQPLERGVQPARATRAGQAGRMGTTVPGTPQDESLDATQTATVEAPAAAERPDGASAPADLFRAVGPVRSPTQDTRLGRQGPAGLDDLSRALPRPQNDPFAATGLRLGTFTLYSTLEQSFGTSSNLTNTLDGVRGAFSETVGSARLLSDWSRHEAEINAVASYRRNDSGPRLDVPRLDLDGRLRIDIDRDWTATFRGALRFDRDDPLLTGPATAEASTRDILAYSAGASLSRAVGRLHTDLDLSSVREDRSDGLFDGAVRRSDDSFTTWSAGLRTGYDVTPAIRPFVAASAGAGSSTRRPRASCRATARSRRCGAGSASTGARSCRATSPSAMPGTCRTMTRWRPRRAQRSTRASTGRHRGVPTSCCGRRPSSTPTRRASRPRRSTRPRSGFATARRRGSISTGG